MKKTLLFTCVITLLTATGCIVSEGGRREHYGRGGHGGFRSHSAVIVPAPVIVAPVVRVRVD
jgi:hypothetical protein